MKKILFAFLIFLGFSACNEEGKDSVEKADSANEAKSDETPAAARVDEASSEFLVKAADGGLAEVEAGKLGEQKATNQRVKAFATMMVSDHTGANAEVKTLAASRNITLPTAPSEENQKKAAKVNEKTGKEFDKAFMDMMVDDHKKTIDLFEKAENNCKDEEVKTFIRNTLPKLRMHLNSADSIYAIVKK